MKKMNFVIFLLAATGVIAKAQYSPVVDGSPQSLLLSETRIDRPLLMHKSQLQFNPGYGFFINSGAYDDAGTKLDYQKEGLASSLHAFSFSVYYGITEYLEGMVSLGYKGSVDRTRDLWIVGFTDFTEVTNLTDTRGMEDLRLGLGIRPTPRNEAFDLAIHAGASIPTASSEVKKPEHSVSYPTVDYTQLSYHYFGCYGKGMTFIQSGLDFKYRLPGVAFNLSFEASNGLGSSKYTAWNAQLDAGTFIYTKLIAPIRYPDQYRGSIVTDIKVFNWFDLYGGITYYMEKGGWKEVGSIKYSQPESSALILKAGFEILTTVHLRIIQYAELSVMGKKSKAYTGIQTSLSYNLFTSK
jgi:hypothetical protein